MSIELYATEVLADLTAGDKAYVVKAGDNDMLALLHHSFGMYIRNKFKLWNNPWDPVIVDGLDYSPNHPDAVSFSVIKRVYALLKATQETGTVSSSLAQVK